MGAHDAVHPQRGRGGGASARPTASAWTSCSRCRACRPRFTRRSRSCASAAACRCSAFRRSRWRSNFATEIIFKGITIYGVVGRRMYDTWHPDDAVPPLRASSTRRRSSRIASRSSGFDEAMRAIKSGEAGKVDLRDRLTRRSAADHMHPMTLNAGLHRRASKSQHRAAQDDSVYKRLNYLESPQAARVQMEGRGEVLILSSNNYLGLCDEPAVVEAGIEGLRALRRRHRRACASSAARSRSTASSRRRSRGSSAPRRRCRTSRRGTRTKA